MSNYIKLKDCVSFDDLIKYGFVEDEANCEAGDTYYHLNNWYTQIGNFRVTINIHSRHIDILCLPKDRVIHNMYNLSVIYRLITDGLVDLTSI